MGGTNIPLLVPELEQDEEAAAEAIIELAESGGLGGTNVPI
ncbi:MAG: hypothetical protein WAM14_27255 [Candidatus Nitrosopolaris sp.]